MNKMASFFIFSDIELEKEMEDEMEVEENAFPSRFRGN